MPKITVTTKQTQEVDACDSCKVRATIGLFAFGPHMSNNVKDWEGELCQPCYNLILGRLEEPTKRTRKGAAK